MVLQPSGSTLPKFGLFPFRSPLLGESLFVFFSSRYLDVSVPGVDFRLSADNTPSVCWVVPFGNLRILRLCAAPRSLSQLTTSFVVSQSQGIHHTPLSALKELLPLLVIYNLKNFSQYVKELISVKNLPAQQALKENCWCFGYEPLGQKPTPK